MRRQRRVPLFYGWVLVAIGFLTMAVGVNARTAVSLLFHTDPSRFRLGQRRDRGRIFGQRLSECIDERATTRVG
jgi:hypothetical protein